MRSKRMTFQPGERVRVVGPVARYNIQWYREGWTGTVIRMPALGVGDIPGIEFDPGFVSSGEPKTNPELGPPANGCCRWWVYDAVERIGPADYTNRDEGGVI